MSRFMHRAVSRSTIWLDRGKASAAAFASRRMVASFGTESVPI
jgi:hypothetical protein